MPDVTQTANRAYRKRRPGVILAFILASGLAPASDPPAGLVKRIAARETENAAARDNYTYRQRVRVDEFDKRGVIAGEYREVRDIIFLPSGERSERFVGKPLDTLDRLKLTDEDFRDIREVQPFLLTTGQLFLYETRFRGEETIDGIDCWVLSIAPRQILEGQRLFDGMIWVDKSDDSIIRSEGQAVPQILRSRSENLFPHFTTIRRKLDDKYWFPVETYGDDTLPFRNGPLRMRYGFFDGSKWITDRAVMPIHRHSHARRSRQIKSRSRHKQHLMRR